MTTRSPGAEALTVHRSLLTSRSVTRYEAEPARQVVTPATVVVLPELFGLTPHVTGVCDVLASHGYRAVAADPYHRTPGAGILPEDPEGRRRGFELLAALTEHDVLGDVADTIRASAAGGHRFAGIVGLSVGGYLGFLAATALDVPAAVLLYPGWLDTTDTPVPGAGAGAGTALDRLPRASGRLLVLVGEDDHVVDERSRTRIRAAFRASGSQHELVTYPGVGHGYLAPARASHDAATATDTWQRALEHLGRAGDADCSACGVGA